MSARALFPSLPHREAEHPRRTFQVAGGGVLIIASLLLASCQPGDPQALADTACQQAVTWAHDSQYGTVGQASSDRSALLGTLNQIGSALQRMSISVATYYAISNVLTGFEVTVNLDVAGDAPGQCDTLRAQLRQVSAPGATQ